MNLVSISCGGAADWGFGMLRDRHVPINAVFSAFASTAIVSVILVLLIRPRQALLDQDQHALRSGTAGSGAGPRRTSRTGGPLPQPIGGSPDVLPLMQQAATRAI